MSEERTYRVRGVIESVKKRAQMPSDLLVYRITSAEDKKDRTDIFPDDTLVGTTITLEYHGEWVKEGDVCLADICKTATGYELQQLDIVQADDLTERVAAMDAGMKADEYWNQRKNR